MAGDINLSVSFDESNAKQAIDKLNKELGSTYKELENIKSKYDENATKIQQIEEKQKQLNIASEKAVEVLKEQGVSEEQINSEKSKSAQLTKEELAELERLKAEQSNLLSSQDSLNQKAEQLKAELTQVRLNPQSVNNTNSLLGTTSKVSSVIKTIWGGFVSVTNKVNQALLKISKVILTVLKTSGKLLLKFTGIQAVANGVKSAFSKMISPLSQVLSRTIGLAKRVFIFTVITKALRAIKTELTNLWSNDKDMVNYWSTIKGNLYTAFAPFYNYVMPIIKKIMQALVNVTAYMARVSATLFGMTATEATNNAKALYKQANATDAVSKSTKKATKTLASFDTAQVLSKQTTTSTSTDTSDTSIAPTFKLANVDTTSIDKFIKELKKKIKAGDWEGVGKLVAQCLNKALKKIDWKKIQKTCKKIATNIGDFINGFVKGFDWALLGSTIANCINTISLSIKTLASKIDWANLGKAISTSFNSFFTTFDWDMLGETLASLINIPIKFMTGFAYNFDWGKFGKGLSDSLNAFIKKVDFEEVGDTLGQTLEGVCISAQNFFKGTNWKKLGEKLRKGIMAFLSHDPLGNLITTVGDVLTSLFTAGAELLNAGKIGGELGTSFSEAVNKFLNDKDLWSKSGKFVSNTIITLEDFLIKSILGIDGDAIFQAILDFAENLDWEVIVLNLGALIAAVLYSAIKIGVKNMISQLPFVSETFKKEAKNLVDSWGKKYIAVAKRDENGEIYYENYYGEIGRIYDNAQADIENSTNEENGYFKLVSELGTKAGRAYAENGVSGLEDYLNEHQDKIKKLGKGASKAYSTGGIDGLVEYVNSKNTESKVKSAGEKTSTDYTEGADAKNTGETIGNDYVEGTSTEIKSENNKTKVKESVSSLFSSDNIILDGTELGKKYVETIKQGMLASADQISTAVEGLFSGDLEIISKISGKQTTSKSTVTTSFSSKVPKLASGAVLPPNKPFMAMVGDQKSGTNIEAPLETIQQAVAEVVGNQTININFKGTMGQLIRVLQPEIEREQRRSSVWG